MTANIKLTSLRHAFVAMLYKRGLDVRTVQKILLMIELCLLICKLDLI